MTPFRASAGFVDEWRHFDLRTEAGIATITFERPERLNALTFDVYADLRDLLDEIEHRDDVAVVVVRGEGRGFCSGGDVHDIIGPLVAMQEGGDTAGLLRFTRMTGELVKAMRACPQPVVAAVDGVAAGAGTILAMAADLRLGTPRARVAFLFNRVGLAGCDMGACAILPRIIGQGRAAELLFTGRTMGGEEAERWGFFNRLAAPEAVLDETVAWAHALADGPTFAHAMTKRMLHEEWHMTIEQAIEAEAQAQAICMQTRDFERAYRAFLAKERPVFEGD